MNPDELHTLPAGHPLRSRPLAGCWYRWTEGTAWREVMPSFGIAKCTYDQLGPSWTTYSVFCWTPPVRG